MEAEDKSRDDRTSIFYILKMFLIALISTFLMGILLALLFVISRIIAFILL